MRLLLVLCVLLGLSVQVSANESSIQKVVMPLEVTNEMQVAPADPSIKDLKWNRWTSNNFVVCAINDTQAQYLHEHLELVKVWVYTRWGLGDVPFSAECRVICVDNAELFQRLFKLQNSTTEIRRGPDGRIKLCVIFLLADSKPSTVVPVPLTEICLAEFNQRYTEEFGWWSYRGMALLNGSMEQIKSQFASMELGPSDSKTLLEMTKEKYMTLQPTEKANFDRRAMVLCVMIRKEFGQDEYLWMLKKTANHGNPEAALKEICGFKGYPDFDLTFSRYMTDLCRDVNSGKTPVSYLQIREKK